MALEHNVKVKPMSLITRNCPRCGKPAKPSMHVDSHEVHVGDKMYHTIKHSLFFKSHPVLGALGMVALGGAAVWKAAEAFHFECEDGHRFKF